MRGELFINGMDAYSMFGLILSDSAVSALAAPRSLKAHIVSECAAEDGERLISSGRYAARDVTLELTMRSRSASDFNRKSRMLERALLGEVFDDNGNTVSPRSTPLRVTTPHIPGVAFKLYYVSSSSFSLFSGRACRLALRFREPNPNDRQA